MGNGRNAFRSTDDGSEGEVVRAVRKDWQRVRSAMSRQRATQGKRFLGSERVGFLQVDG